MPTPAPTLSYTITPSTSRFARPTVTIQENAGTPHTLAVLQAPFPKPTAPSGVP